MGAVEHRVGHQSMPKRLSSERTLPPCSVPGRQIVIGSYALQHHVWNSVCCTVISWPHDDTMLLCKLASVTTSELSPFC